MFRALIRGAVAGAAGTTALNAATYADMAVSARPSSSTPQQTVETLAERAGRPVPGEGDDRQNRLTGLGSLSGIMTGVGIGSAAGLLAPVLRRLPIAVSGALLGGAAMALTDAPMMKLGITDPKSWSTTDWASDAVPHLVYGAVTVGALRAMQPRGAAKAVRAAKAAGAVGAAKAAQPGEAEGSAKKGRTGKEAGSAKAARVAQAAKSAQAAKVAKAAQAGKAAQAAQLSKAAKTAQAVKAAQAAQLSKAAKTAQAVKAAQAAQVAKTAQAAKAATTAAAGAAAHARHSD